MNNKYAFVLIPGAWQDHRSFALLADELCRLGHEVHTPAVAGHGPNGDKSVTHAMQVASVALYITLYDLKNIVLVGHSFGGTIVAKLAEKLHERIRKAVFLSAFVLKDGNSVMDEVPPEFQKLFDQLSKASSDGSISLPYEIWEQGFHNGDMAAARDTARLISSQPRKGLYEKLNLKKFYELIEDDRLTCVYVQCTQDRAMPEGEYSWVPRFPKRLGSKHQEVMFPGANHVPHLMNPEGTAAVLVMAARI